MAKPPTTNIPHGPSPAQSLYPLVILFPVLHAPSRQSSGTMSLSIGISDQKSLQSASGPFLSSLSSLSLLPLPLFFLLSMF